MNINDKRNEFFDKMYETFGEENIKQNPKFFIETCTAFAASLLCMYQVPEAMAKEAMLGILEGMYTCGERVKFRNFVNPDTKNTQ